MSGVNDPVDVLLVEDNALDADMTMRALARYDDSRRIIWVHDAEAHFARSQDAQNEWVRPAA
jgi:hypothetical protein